MTPCPHCERPLRGASPVIEEHEVVAIQCPHCGARVTVSCEVPDDWTWEQERESTIRHLVSVYTRLLATQGPEAATGVSAHIYVIEHGLHCAVGAEEN